MARLGGANEVVVGDLQQLGSVSEQHARGVDLFLGRHPVGLRRPLNLETVFVGSRQHHRVVAQQAMPSSKRIGVDGCIGVADVGCVVDVVDRRGDVVRAHHANLTAATERSTP